MVSLRPNLVKRIQRADGCAERRRSPIPNLAKQKGLDQGGSSPARATRGKIEAEFASKSPDQIPGGTGALYFSKKLPNVAAAASGIPCAASKLAISRSRSLK